MQKKYLYLMLIATCFLLYANSLNNAFVSDDIPGILNNPFISTPLRFWLNPPSLINSLNYLMVKSSPFFYHLTNIILHSLNTILIFLFLQLFFKTEASFLGACLFAAHPIHTEAVAWISGSPYLITSIFILTAYFLYYYATAPDSGKHTFGFKFRSYLASLLVFTYYLWGNIAFYFVFPFFLILSDVTFGRYKKTWKLWLPFLAVLIFRILLAKSIISQRAEFVAKEMSSNGNIIWTNPLFNFTYSFFQHLWLLIWPAKLSLYREPMVITVRALTAGIISLVIFIFALPFIFKKAKVIFLGFGIFVLFLAPTYSPITISWLVAERYLYFPSVILSILLAFFYERVIVKSERFNRLILALIIFIIAGFGVRTVARNEDWKTPERLWRSTVLVSPDSPRAHNNMGDVYAQEGNTEGAIREFKRAIELKPDYADVYHNLANMYHHTGDLKEAVKYYTLAVSYNPALFESLYNLGVIYLDAGEFKLARTHLEKAVEARPEDASAQLALKLAIEKRSAKK